MVGSGGKESAQEWQMFPLWRFAATKRESQEPSAPRPKPPSIRTRESERARLNAYRSHGRGLEYAREQTRINNERAKIARKCIREGKPVPPDFPKWCREVLSPDKEAKAKEGSKARGRVTMAAVKHYREHGRFGDETPAYAIKAACDYIDARKRGAEVRAGVAIAAWCYKASMGAAIKARKHARNRVKSAISNRGLRARHSASKDIGCTSAFFKAYIQSMFKPGMTWENYGKEWHIDHVVPLSFAGDDVEGIRTLGDYRNLQPLWAAENMLKNDSMPDALTEWQAAAAKTILARRVAREAIA